VSQERSRLLRSAKTGLSLVLGLLMFTFGFLKFVNPTIDGWFHVQIQQSHLPHSGILMGKIAEIRTGNSLPTSAVPAVASKTGGSHFIDRLLEPRPRDACGGLCPPSARSSARGTTTRYQASGEPTLRPSSWCDSRHSGLEGQPD
jgi:hypothetical protein